MTPELLAKLESALLANIGNPDVKIRKSNVLTHGITFCRDENNIKVIVPEGMTGNRFNEVCELFADKIEAFKNNNEQKFIII